MKSLTLFLILFILSTTFLYAKEPLWVTTYGGETGYDESGYLTGFGMAPLTGDSPENLESARLAALRDASSRVKTVISSQLELLDEEREGESLSQAKSTIQASVQLEISGIKEFLKYYSKKESRYYALCIIERKTFLNSLKLERSRLLAEYEGKVKLIVKLLAQKKREDAYNEYLEANTILEKLNQNFLTANYLGEGGESLKELYAIFARKGQLYEELKAAELKNLDDAVRLLFKSYKEVELKGRRVVFLPAQYKTTKISSEFFYYFSRKAEAYLESKLKARVVDAGELEKGGELLVFRGSFYDSKGSYYLFYNLYRVESNENLGTAEIKLPQGVVEGSGLQIVPDNMEVAVEDNRIFAQGSSDDRSAVFEVWSNKGEDNLLFRAGEEVEFYIRTNKSGYVTIIYHLAGKTRLRTPLIVNQYIPPSQVNLPVRIDFTFEVYPPFGSETAQFIFSSAPLNNIATKIVSLEGEEYEVLAEDYESFIKKTRGLKQKKTNEVTERYLSITTFK